eukprot:m.48095 g.48095  ORF g.48095 m.48095 type:complete len:194 (+) comp47661_c0_seq2:22-603(+)
MWGVFAAIGRFWSRLLYSLGLASKNAAIVLLGLDNAGKTTLLYRLRTGEMHSFLPTQRAQQQQLQIGQLRLNAWDVGGHERVRALWQTYAIQANAIIFLIDSADRARLEEARNELLAVLPTHCYVPVTVPVVVLANKSDLPESIPDAEITRLLQLDKYISGEMNERQVQLFRTSLVNGSGVREAFAWLESLIE